MVMDKDTLEKIKRACNPQKAIFEMAEYVAGYDTAITEAVQASEAAEQNATNALNTANSVKAVADTANSNASVAKTTAEQAQATANTANTAANNAQTTADKAKESADSANIVAVEARDTANTASSTANSAKTLANNSLNNLSVSADQSTVNINTTKNNGNSETDPLPVADATRAGVMNSATYLAVEGLNGRVTALEAQIRTYIVVFPNTEPTQTEITTAYRTAYPTAPNPPIDGTVLIDNEKDLYYQWVAGSSVWIKISGQKIGMFTNDTLGLIKGSTIEGQIEAEADGTGSLNGYDALKSGVTNNTSAISGLTARMGNVETKNSQQDTAIGNNADAISGLTTRMGNVETKNSQQDTAIGNNSTSINNINTTISGLETKTDTAVADINFQTTAEKATLMYTDLGGLNWNEDLPIASAAQSGIITPAMFNTWNTPSVSKPRMLFKFVDAWGTNMDITNKLGVLIGNARIAFTSAHKEFVEFTNHTETAFTTGGYVTVNVSATTSPTNTKYMMSGNAQNMVVEPGQKIHIETSPDVVGQSQVTDFSWGGEIWVYNESYAIMINMRALKTTPSTESGGGNTIIQALIWE